MVRNGESKRNPKGTKRYKGVQVTQTRPTTGVELVKVAGVSHSLRFPAPVHPHDDRCRTRASAGMV